MTLLLTHKACLDHLTPPGHPERPDRLRAVEQVLAQDKFNALVRDLAPEGNLDQVTLCHGEHYVTELRHIAPTSGMIYIDGDTSMSPGTWEAVMRGVGGAVTATDAVMSGKHPNAFVAVRPPGHHAEKSTPMGFCFFDNAAIAARHAQRKYGIARAAVVDFDVHHGNGIDYIFYDDPKVFYYSLHGAPDHIYPHSGYVHETGRGAGTGYTCNITLSLESSGDDWLRQFELNLLDCERKIRPDYLLVGAGFDAHREDPFGVMKVEDHHFLEAVRLLKKIADDNCAGKVGFVLEGGYSITVLERLVPEIITVLAEDRTTQPA